MIPVFKPHIGPAEFEAAQSALEMGWLGMGSYVKEFEDALALALELPDERRVVAVNTCTSALHLALELAGVGPGDEVITPALNNIGDFQAIAMSGAKPVFADIEETTLGIDPDSLLAMITPKVKAVIALHYMGVPCEITRVREIAKNHSLRVIEDAAHAIGTKHQGSTIGSTGDLTCFSFDPIKTITCIDGGAVVTQNSEEAGRLYPSRLLGMTQKNSSLYSNTRALRYDVLQKGYRYHLANLHAAIGLQQLRMLPQFIERRQRYCRLYNRLFDDISEIVVPQTDFSHVSPFNYVIRVLDGKRSDLQASLQNEGIDTGIHWVPGNRFTWLKDCRGARRIPLTDRIGNEILTLPLWSFMEDAIVELIANTVRTFFGYSPK